MNKANVRPARGVIEDSHMRALYIALATAALVGLTGASNKLVTAAADYFEPHDAVIYGLHIALPEDVKTYPAELVPLP